MAKNNPEREKSLDQVQALLNEQARIKKTQEETGKNFSPALDELGRRMNNALKGQSQENK
jgi:hypothetical protein